MTDHETQLKGSGELVYYKWWSFSVLVWLVSNLPFWGKDGGRLSNFNKLSSCYQFGRCLLGRSDGI